VVARVAPVRVEIVVELPPAAVLSVPAGAASTAAALKLGRERLKGKTVALVLSGGNLPPEELRRILPAGRRKRG
jgi:threonine dehydratase